MKQFGKMMLVLAVCVILGGAVSASAHVVVRAAPFSSVSVGVGASCGPAYGVPYGYVTTGVSVLPVTTAIAYSPYVVTAYPVYPVMYYPAPIVYPRIVTVPTYAVIR